LIVEAFNDMSDKRFKVVGSGEQLREIKKIAKQNIEVLGYVEDSELVKLMQKAKAFVYVALEDFGIVPLEAASCGTPVIALNQGGTKETIVERVNGLHFNKQDKESIIEVVKRFEKIKFEPKKVRESVLKYANFKENFKNFVDEKCKKQSQTL
jgi:glycosyltransferase involved in cell wall biosynthesis